ncbi:MAG: hypothetical protein QNJ67_18535 [Kiloniellales bacterium]|nr:hypothetical protein [Kiloniellales bacterium]
MLGRNQKTNTVALAAWLAVSAWAIPAGAQTATDLDCSGCVDTKELASGSIGSRKLQDNSVGDRKIKDGAIGQNKIKDDAIGQRKIKDRAIGTLELKLGAVDTGNIQDGAVSAAKLTEDAVFGRILVVRNDPADTGGNCEELLAVLAGITDNDAESTYLILLEPGTYDCGASPVQMKPFVDIEGAGRSTTLIRGRRSDEFIDGVVRGASNAELRRLSVRNVVRNKIDAVAIYNDQDGFRITDVRAESVTRGAEGSFAIVIDGPSARATLTNVVATASPANSISAGVTVFDGARADMIHVDSLAGQAVDTSNGLLIGEGGTATLRSSTMTGVSEGIFSISPGDRINVVSSQLLGYFSAKGFGTFRCIATTADSNFFLMGPGCGRTPPP